jgi:hypothetical protein
MKKRCARDGKEMRKRDGKNCLGERLSAREKRAKKRPLRKGLVVKLKRLGRQAQLLVHDIWIHLFSVDKLRGREAAARERRQRKAVPGR